MPPIFASFSGSIKSYGLIRSLGAGGRAPVPPIFSQIFQSTGSFIVPTGVTTVDYLVVAGGGGGGASPIVSFGSGGGGGAGGVLTGTS